MGPAVPSLVEASRGLPSVKPSALPTDDDLVTSVAVAAHVDEPVSPELALVDPVLAAQLRALLPEIEPQIGLGPPQPVLRVLPAPPAEPDLLDVMPLVPPAPPAEPDLLDVMPLVPPPNLADLAAIAPRPVGPVTPPPLFPSRADRWRALAKSFAAGAAVATFVTVGVVAKLGEGPPEPSTDVESLPPRILPAPTDGAAGDATAGSPATKAPATPGSRSGPAAAGHAAATKPQTSTKSGAQRRAEKRAAAAKRAQKKAALKQASESKPAAAPSQTPKPKTAAPERPRSGKYPTAAPAAPAPRRFAWAPVDGAVGYRIELFRGTKQVLQERTKDPVYELASPWRHAGRTERLTSGSYRWYVWPVFSSGPAAKAVVQAQLRVP